ncbi:MAG: hypothetical protein ACNA7G_15425, partial [Methylobacter sp.]
CLHPRPERRGFSLLGDKKSAHLGIRTNKPRRVILLIYTRQKEQDVIFAALSLLQRPPGFTPFLSEVAFF